LNEIDEAKANVEKLLFEEQKCKRQQEEFHQSSVGSQKEPMKIKLLAGILQKHIDDTEQARQHLKELLEKEQEKEEKNNNECDSII